MVQYCTIHCCVEQWQKCCEAMHDKTFTLSEAAKASLLHYTSIIIVIFHCIVILCSLKCNRKSILWQFNFTGIWITEANRQHMSPYSMSILSCTLLFTVRNDKATLDIWYEMHFIVHGELIQSSKSGILQIIKMNIKKQWWIIWSIEMKWCICMSSK